MKKKIMTISKFAKAAGISVEAVRFYQRYNLLTIPSANNTYREYTAEHLQQLYFIKRAKTAGFTLKEIKALLNLSTTNDKSHIQELAKTRLFKLNAQIKELRRIAKFLNKLIQTCQSEEKKASCSIVKAFMD